MKKGETLSFSHSPEAKRVLYPIEAGWREGKAEPRELMLSASKTQDGLCTFSAVAGLSCFMLNTSMELGIPCAKSHPVQC